jgi:phospholipid transport system substrate-binding protein
MTIRTASLLAFLGMLLFAAPAAQADIGDPEGFMQAFGDRAVAELTDTKVPREEKERRFRTLLIEGFDIDGIAQFIAARYWRAASEAQRGAFVETFKDYLVQRFLPLFDEYDGTSFAIESVRADSKRDNIAWVTMRFERPQGEAVRTDWRIRKNDGTYAILDVKAEGASMAITLRDEYNAVMRREGGLEGLIRVLREQLAKGAYKQG